MSTANVVPDGVVDTRIASSSVNVAVRTSAAVAVTEWTADPPSLHENQTYRTSVETVWFVGASTW